MKRRAQAKSDKAVSDGFLGGLVGAVIAGPPGFILGALIAGKRGYDKNPDY
jgi:hypothetical protein